MAPAALLVSGETGIGKSTLWLDAVAYARECGFVVLSARAAMGESALAHAALADLLSGTDSRIWSDLPSRQRRALDDILLRSNTSGARQDMRAAATAVLSVVECLALAAPVLLAIDDLQWLDAESADILDFVTRRLSGPVGVLATIGSDSGSTLAATGLQLSRTADVHRICLPPMTIGALHVMLSERLGRSLPRPALVRIHDVSGGNPYYAIELALALDVTPVAVDEVLPGSLTDVVRIRVGQLGADVQHALLVAAALTVPTLELIAHALNASPDEVLALLESAEDAGIVTIDGCRLRFAHPLLISGIYAGASPSRRRKVHRRLAEGVVDPELRARHLALGSATADPRVADLLDSAAESARRRGAQTTAAELLDLALAKGGDTSMRRIRSAACHFAAGDVRRARSVLEQSVASLQPGAERARALSVLAGVHLFDDSVSAAAELLRQGIADCERSTVRVHMLLAQGFTQLNAGDTRSAIGSTESALTEAADLGDAALLDQARALRLVVTLHAGDGLDEPGIRRAPVSEDLTTDTPVPFWSTVNDALLQAWSGQLDLARTEISRLSRLCQERGDEHGRLYVGFHTALIEVWRGEFAAAATLAAEATERAAQLGGDIPLAMAATIQATINALAGRVPEARLAGRAALEASRRSGANGLSRSAMGAVAFLESSLGNHAAVASLVNPFLEADAATPRATEIVTAAYLPDAIEALVNLGRFDEADVLIGRLERNGERLDRAWMLAVGGRCRAMLSGALGDLDAATSAVEEAMRQHDRIPMPFERARTQVVMGLLQRRQRRKDDAAVTLGAALASFEALHTPLWAERVRAELARSNTGPRKGDRLTPSERAVADLAASGLTNRDVAASLFISPKTVESNLARIYCKLNIHSRAELGRHMTQMDAVGLS